MNYSKNLQAAIDVLRKAKKVLVLTGAGISAESGIPTFRGGGGSSVWRGMPFDQLSSARLVQDDLPLLWDWFDYRRGIVGGCRPNQAHETLARASGIPRFRSFTVVTQNIDGLHQAAGTREVIELHGSIWRARCLSCGKVESLKVLPQDERPPVCRDCMDSMRPDVVLFGEPLPMTNLFVAQEHAGKCDVCIVIGTSAQVYPAAALPHKARANGAIVIEVNPEETELTPHTDISLQGKASEVLFDLFTFLEEPFEELEEIEELDVDIKLDEIRLDIEPEPVASEPETESPSLTFLLNEEFESNRELILEVGYEGAGAQIYLFKPDDGLPFFFVSGSGVTVDGSGGETPIEWEPELVGSVADGIKTIADGDKIFYADSVFVNPGYRSEIHSYLEETLKSLPEEEIRKLELFQRPSTADEWISPVKRDVAGLPDSTHDVSVPETSQTDQPAQISNPFAEPIAETETVEKVATEEVSDRHFILFWRETSVTAAERLGKPLNVVSSNHLDGILRGDTLWVATVEGGELVMIGRMRVGEVIERQEAEARFGDENVWKSNQFAVALDESACEIPRRIHLGETAFDLRFMEDESDRFISVEGRISRSQTRKMRELTFGSAELLSSLWEGDRDGDISDEDLEPKVINFDPASESEPEPVEIDEDKLDRFAGCLLGGAIGDALGAPIEFQSIGAIRGTYGDAGITDYAPAYGKLGAITDDTQMTLFTAEGLLRAETRRSHRGICYPARIIYHAYLRWLQTQGATLEDESVKMHVYDAPSWLRDVPELNALRAPGNTCLEALGSGLMGTLEEPLNDRKGCGGVMRVAPIGLIALDPFRLASEAAAITHGHPSGYLSAGVLALIIGKVINGSSLMKAVEHAVYEILPQHDGHEETFKACDRAIRLAKLQLGLEVETGSDDVAPSSEGDEPRIGLPSPEAVESLGAGWIAEEALAISIYCSLVHEEDFEKAVLLAVNHSGDSDSTGAITGNILGALLGKERIPSRWLEELELRDVIAEISRDLLIGFRSDTQWSDRYPGI